MAMKKKQGLRQDSEAVTVFFRVVGKFGIDVSMNNRAKLCVWTICHTKRNLNKCDVIRINLTTLS